MYTAQQLKIARKTLRTNVIANAIAANDYAFCTQQQVNKICINLYAKRSVQRTILCTATRFATAKTLKQNAKAKAAH